MTTTGKSLTQLIQEKIDRLKEKADRFAKEGNMHRVNKMDYARVELEAIQTALNEVTEYCEQEWIEYLDAASREKDFALSVVHQTRADAYRDILVKLKGDKI